MTGRTSTQSAARLRAGGARAAQRGTGTVPGAVAPVTTHGPRQSRAPVPVPPTTDFGTDLAAHWPVQDFLELGALPGAVPSSRLHARHILWEWALTPLSEAVEQVVSELIANSVAAARAMPHIKPVRLWLLSDTRNILVLVWRCSWSTPTETTWPL